MSQNKVTSEVIDKILLVSLSGGVISTSLVLPGSTLVFGPLLERYYKGYDKRQKDREYRRLINYMRRQQLLRLEPRTGNGLVLTEKGKQRAQKAALDEIAIDTSQQWDGRWRMVIFDIPESFKTHRDLFAGYLKGLGMYQLQKSVWLHPLDAREEVTTIASSLGVARYVTLVDGANIDHHKELEQIFKTILSTKK